MLLADGKRMSAISAVGTRRSDTVRQVKLIEMRLKCLSVGPAASLRTVRAISAPTIIYENCKNRIKFLNAKAEKLPNLINPQTAENA